jgi:hypothetical protein
MFNRLFKRSPKQTAVIVGKYAFDYETRLRSEHMASAHVQLAYSSTYRPWMRSYRDCVGLVWRELDGWRFAVDHLDGFFAFTPTGQRVVPSGDDRQDRDDAIRACLRLLFEKSWRPEYGADIPPFIDEEDELKLRAWICWQMRYHHARDRGYSDQEASLYADNRHILRDP